MWTLIETPQTECACVNRILVQDECGIKLKKKTVTFAKIDFQEYYPSLHFLLVTLSHNLMFKFDY